MSFEKALALNQLFDYYESLLTPKQKQVFVLYFHEDLSYQEIADELTISKSAVYDILRRTNALLAEYENKLGFAQKYQRLFTELRALDNEAVALILNEFDKGEKYE